MLENGYKIYRLKNNFFKLNKNSLALHQIPRPHYSTVLLPISHEYIPNASNRIVQNISTLLEYLNIYIIQLGGQYNIITNSSQVLDKGNFAWSIMDNIGNLVYSKSKRLPSSLQMNVLYTEISPILDALRFIPSKFN